MITRGLLSEWMNLISVIKITKNSTFFLIKMHSTFFDFDSSANEQLQGYPSFGLAECSLNFHSYVVVIILLMIYIILNTSKTKLSLTDNKLLFSLFLCRWSRLMLYLPSLVRLHKTKKYLKIQKIPKKKPKTYLPTDIQLLYIYIYILPNISI